ncbi:hypothetical protein SRHO_G00264500 [Serrasalmus rhombeus]
MLEKVAVVKRHVTGVATIWITDTVGCRNVSNQANKSGCIQFAVISLLAPCFVYCTLPTDLEPGFSGLVLSACFTCLPVGSELEQRPDVGFWDWGTGDLGQACQMRAEFVRGTQSGGPPAAGPVMMRGGVMLKRSPVAALAACRELIRAAEGACLGLRVTLSMQAPWGEAVVGLRTRVEERRGGNRNANCVHFSVQTLPLWLVPGFGWKGLAVG